MKWRFSGSRGMQFYVPYNSADIRFEIRSDLYIELFGARRDKYLRD